MNMFNLTLGIGPDNSTLFIIIVVIILLYYAAIIAFAKGVAMDDFLVDKEREWDNEYQRNVAVRDKKDDFRQDDYTPPTITAGLETDVS